MLFRVKAGALFALTCPMGELGLGSRSYTIKLSYVRCVERSDRSVPGCRRRGGWTLAHAHPEPRHLFFCQAPAQPRACGGGCAGRYTLLFMAWFVLLSDRLLCLKGVDF